MVSVSIRISTAEQDAISIALAVYVCFIGSVHQQLRRGHY